MKKHLFGFILAGLLFTSIAVFAQNANYATKKIKDVEYYIYKVDTSEGLMAIARKFNVSVEEINTANPELQNDLKVGQKILIPIKKTEIKKADLNVEFKEHKVKKKQTLFAISQKYEVSQEDIIKYNPQIDKGLQEDMILKIPSKEKEKKVVKSEKTIAPKPTMKLEENSKLDNKKTTVHQVQSDETLYSISKRYNVEIEDIVKLNPSSANKLAIGMEIKIPTNGSKNVLNQKDDTIIATPKSSVPSNQLTDKTDYPNINSKKTIKIAFLLPFMLEHTKTDASVERFIDFYAGSLMAIEEAKQKGISFEIYTYDTEKSEEKVTAVLTNAELKTMDLIVGPAFSNQISIVADFAKANKINTLIPFSSKIPDIDTNAYLFKFNPGTEVELKYSTELLTGKYKNDNIIFAEIEGISTFDEGQIWCKALQKELTNNDLKFSKIKLTNSEAIDFTNIIKKNEKNIVIFNTDKFAYIVPYVPNLRQVSNNYDVILFEQYSWRNQDKILAQNIFISPFTTKYNAKEISTFNDNYTQHFGKTASKNSPRFDLLGYDLSNYFIILINKYGNKFIEKIGSFNFSSGIQSQLQFERISNGSGFVNQKLYLGEE